MIVEEAFDLLAGLVYCHECRNEVTSFPPDHETMMCNILDHRTDSIDKPIQCKWYRARLV